VLATRPNISVNPDARDGAFYKGYQNQQISSGLVAPRPPVALALARIPKRALCCNIALASGFVWRTEAQEEI